MLYIGGVYYSKHPDINSGIFKTFLMKGKDMSLGH